MLVAHVYGSIGKRTWIRNTYIPSTPVEQSNLMAEERELARTQVCIGALKRLCVATGELLAGCGLCAAAVGVGIFGRRRIPCALLAAVMGSGGIYMLTYWEQCLVWILQALVTIQAMSDDKRVCITVGWYQFITPLVETGIDADNGLIKTILCEQLFEVEKRAD